VLMQDGTVANLVQNSYIGLDATGSNLLTVSSGNLTFTGNDGDGVQIIGSNDNVVGGDSLSLVNVISGNTSNGIELDDCDSTTIVFSYIGTSATGANRNNVLGNQGDGLLITDSNHTFVGFSRIGGGGDPPGGNVISGNHQNGIHIGNTDHTADSSSATIIGYNLIGTDASGTFAIGNAGYGIFLDNVQSTPAIGGTSIGGTNAGAGNVFTGNLISGNQQGGIDIDDRKLVVGGSVAGTVGNLILGDFIGTNLSGVARIGNTGDGIDVFSSSNDTIGGTATGSGNLISGNTGTGLSITGSSSESIYGNTIGMNFHGTAPLGNGTGIALSGSSNVSIGSTAGTGGNLIAGNLNDGVDITDGSLNTLVANTVGATVTGLGNGGYGINLTNSGNNVIGGPPNFAPSGLIASLGSGANTIFGNSDDGIFINVPEPASSFAANEIDGNLISRNGHNGIHVITPLSGPAQIARIFANFIGTDATGLTTYDTNDQTLGNGFSGILLENGSGAEGFITTATIVVELNVVSGNGVGGITVQPPAGSSSLYASVVIQGNLIGTDKDGANTGDAAGRSFGNGDYGIRLDGVRGVTIGNLSGIGSSVSLSLGISLGNLISGNLGPGIQIDSGFQETIAANLIGVVLATGPSDQLVVRAQDSHGNDAGNLSDGILLLGQGSANAILSNLVSANRSYGILASGGGVSPQPIGLLIEANFIGTSNDGTQVLDDRGNNFGNGADGILLDSVTGATIGGATVNTGSGNSIVPVRVSIGFPPAVSGRNVISGNRADGIDVLQSLGILITNNRIGTDVNGSTTPGNAQADFGNATNGIVINQSSAITIGGTTPGTGTGVLNNADRNIIAGNHANGVLVVGTPPASSGSLGANTPVANVIQGNYIGVGIGPSGQFVAAPNAVDGVVLSSVYANTIGGTTPLAGNVISGNSHDGIFLVNDAVDNAIENNLVGTDPTGTVRLGNSADGVLLLDVTTLPTGATITGTVSGNTISSNTISGNSGNGLQILGLGANANTVSGNVIGLGASGTPIPNQANGILLNGAGAGNVIGGVGAGNLIAGNTLAGIEIANTTTGTTVAGNFIGTNQAGTPGLGNGGNGVLIVDGINNTVGGTTVAAGAGMVGGTDVPAVIAGGAGNLIAGNGQWGIQIELSGSSSATVNTVQGNYIGTDASGTRAIANGSGGVLVNDLSTQSSNPIPQQIGGPTPGAGNLISGNTGIGIELLGPQTSVTGQNNVIQGNLIGLSTAGAALGNGTGILIENSPNNLIGGLTARPGTGPGNVISGNGQSGFGILVLGNFSTGNQIQGNAIGTNDTGNGFPDGETEGSLAQRDGVFIDGASGNLVGGMEPGAGNALSGNLIGVEIDGIPQSTGQFAGSGNTVQGNLIGTDASGTIPVSNLDLGVYIDNSKQNLIGPGNVISANGIAGVEIFNQGSKGNLVAGNVIGLGLHGQGFLPHTAHKDLISVSLPPAIPVFSGAQLNGVVILGASQNTVGQLTGLSGSQANTISGNVEVGVYVTSRDFGNRSYPVPVNNVISGNTIQSDSLYGVLFYDAPNNTIRPFTSQNRKLVGNTLGHNQSNFLNFLSGSTISTPVPTSTSRPKSRGHTRKATTPGAHPKVIPSSPFRVRPRVPALFPAAGSQGRPHTHPTIEALPSRAHKPHREAD